MTDPLPTSITNKIKARNQSVRWVAVLREVREFRAYCCNVNSDTIMGVQKQPVAIVTVSPNPVCFDNAITLDFTGSYAPGSTITAYAIDWGDGLSTDPAAVSGNTHQYTIAGVGEYTITATVTEGSADALTQSVEIEVNVIDCSDTLLIASIYAATDGNGVYYWE